MCFPTFIKSTLIRPNKSNYKGKTHQEADDWLTGEFLSLEEEIRKALTQAMGQQLHHHLTQLPKEGSKVHFHRGPLHK